MTSSNTLAWNTKQNLQINLGSKDSLVGNEISPVYVISKKKVFCQKHRFQALPNFWRILCKIEFEKVCVLIWTNFDSFANTSAL